MTTNPLYTDADVDLVAETIAQAWGYRNLANMDAVPDVREGLGARADARAVLDALAAAGRLTAPAPAATLPYVHHLLDAYLTGQPLNFHADPVPLDVQRRLEHAVATGQMGTVPAPAAQVMTVTDADVDLAHDAFARAWTAHERMHPVPDVCTHEPAEDCCDRAGLRAALDALAAAGRLAPPRPVPADEQPADRHGLTVDADGGWSVIHPDGCIVSTPTGPALICNVGDLAAEQRPAAQLPAGRYDVEANDLGDLLLIGDRVETAPAADREG
ncbi:hypothetical protein [Micromonospora haikouensis]|uniref:hypothetical protein n=1 Tax=Micromonospora haikouensis TaxID=686309 RepID=UPI003D71067E